MSEKPPVTQQPPAGYGMGYNNPQMGYQPAQVAYTSQPGETVVVQPIGVQQFQAPNIPNCPPGMEYLASLDQVQIHQVIHLSEGEIDQSVCGGGVIGNGIDQNSLV